MSTPATATGLLTDQQALDVFHALPSVTDPDQRAFMTQRLGEYRDAKVASGEPPFQPGADERRATAQKFEGLFSGLESIDQHLTPEQREQVAGLTELSTNPDEAKARMVNQAYVQSAFPAADPSIIATNWPAVKKTVAKQVLNLDTPDISDVQLYRGLGGVVQKQKAEREMKSDLVSKMAMAGLSDDSPAHWLDAYKAALPALEQSPGFEPANRDSYRQLAEQVFTESVAKRQSLRPAAEQIFAHLKEDVSMHAAEKLPGGVPLDVSGNSGEAVQLIKSIPADERPLLYSIVADMGRVEQAKSGDADSRSFVTNTQQAVGRMLSDLYRTNRAAFDNAAIVQARAVASAADRVGVVGDRAPGESVLDWVNRSAPGARGIVDFVSDVIHGQGTAAPRPLTPDEQKQLKAEVADLQDTAAIARQLQDITRGSVNPLRGSNFATARILYPAIGMSGPVIEALTPYAGIPLLINTTIGQSVDAFSRKGLPPEQAQKLGVVAGAVQAPLVFVSAKMVAGGVPFLDKLVKAPVEQTTAALLARGATNLAAETVTQNALAAAQELTPATVQWVAHGLSDEFPKVDWHEELKGFAQGRIDTFWAMLPMVALGTGVATFGDAAYGRRYLDDARVLRAAGLDEEMTRRIIDAPTLEAKQGIVRELWPELDRDNVATQQAHFADLDADLKASYREQASAEPSSSVVRRDDGTFEVRDVNGKAVDVANTPESALQLLRAHTDAESASGGRALSDMVDFITRAQEPGSSIELTGERKTLADRISAGDITPAEAQRAIDVAVGLHHVEAGATPDTVRVLGENVSRQDAATGFFEDVSKIHDGAHPLTVVEEHAEGYIKRRLAKGDVAEADLTRWRDEVEGPGGDRSRRGMIEWFSNMAKAYLTGHADNASIPATFRAFLNRLRDYAASVFDTAGRLMALERDGKLPGDFKTHLARAAGVDEAWLLERARQEEAGAIKAETERTRVELGEWIRGKLPRPDVAAANGEPLAGELRALFDGMAKPDKNGRLTLAKARAFFAKGASYSGLDSIAESAREAGFDINTPAELLDAVDRALRGTPVYGYPREEPQIGTTFSLANRDALDDVQRIFAPQTRGERAATAAGMLREHGATLAQRADRAEAYLDGARKHMDALSSVERWAFVDAVETGKSFDNPALQAIADRFRRILDYKRNEVQALGTGKLDHYVRDYYPHIWQDPEKAARVLREARDQRQQLGGRTDFLKEREIPTIAEGRALGLEPVSDNPVDLVLLRAREMDKYILSQRWLADMKERGLVKFVPAGEEPPEGYAKINDKIATVYGPRTGAVGLPEEANIEPEDVTVHGRRIMGEYWAPDEVAQVANNYLSPGLRGSPTFRAYLTVANVLNQFQLGLSAFHLGFTSLDAATSKLAVGLEHLVSGNFAEAGKAMAGTPLAPFANAIEGDKVLKEWFKPGSQGEEMARIVDGLKAAGGRAKMDSFYQTTIARRMLDAFRAGHYVPAVLRAPFAAIETAAKPIMEWIVPRQKLGVFADLARRELARLPEDASRDQVRAAMAKAWDSVDNRMGQMVYDNLFWNKVAKDAGMASIRSLGWNLGTLRELGGGAIDGLAAGKAMLKGQTPEFTHRMAYVVAMPLLTGIIGATTQYLLTGKGPQELRDYFFPKTGEDDPQGRPIRLTLPSYMKDVYHYAHDPVGTAVGKVHPAIALGADMLMNRDFFGAPIRNSDDPVMKQITDTAKHAGGQFAPMGVSNFLASRRTGQSAGEQAANFVGIVNAPKWLSMSNAEQLADKLAKGKFAPSNDTVDRDKLDAKGRILRALRDGTDAERKAASAEMDSMMASGQLTRREARSLVSSARESFLVERVNHLDAKEAMRVFAIATPSERETLHDVVGRKIVRAQLPVPERAALLHRLESLSHGGKN